MTVSRRHIFFFISLAFMMERIEAQTLRGVDSEIWADVYGTVYRLDPNPYSPNPLTPVYYNEETTGPIQFELSAEPASVWVFSLLLPDSSTGDEGYPVYFAYDDSSGYHVQSKAFWNASRPRTFTADSLGKVTIGVGMRFGARECWTAENYTSQVICLTTRLSDGFTLIDTSHLTITNGVTWQCGFDYYEVRVEDLTAGFTYTIDAQSGGIQPIVTGKERGGSIKFASVEGNPGSEIEIDFVLPSKLEGTEEQGTIPISFSQYSTREASGALWNPESSHVMSLDQYGSLAFDLGFTITIPDTTPPGEYAAQVIWSITFTGNRQQFKSEHRSSGSVLQSEAVLVVRTLPPIPKAISLYPNFPNPFNSSTTIRYDLPRQADVSLKVYDLLGREIVLLIDNNQYGGEHAVQWDAVNVPSGVYFYRLVAGNFAQVKEMLLVK